MNDLKEIGGFIVSADPYVNHDNSLSGNGTLTSPLGVVPGYNETVLWSGDTQSGCLLSESIWNFEKLKIYFAASTTGNGMNTKEMFTRFSGTNIGLSINNTYSNNYQSIYTQSWKFTDDRNLVSSFKAKEWWGNTGDVSSRDANNLRVIEIVGINRIGG